MIYETKPFIIFLQSIYPLELSPERKTLEH
jgi:hypothetical protein